jgi:hypothetical protein
MTRNLLLELYRTKGLNTNDVSRESLLKEKAQYS